MNPATRFSGLPAALVLAIPFLALAAAADDFDQRVVAEPGGTLRVRLDGGSVEIETHGEDEIRVESPDTGRGGLQLELSGDGGEFELRGHRPVLGWLRGSAARVRIRLPEEFSVDLRTSGGDVVVEGLEGRVRAETSGGSVKVSEIEGSAELQTSGGDVVVSEVAGPVRVKTSGGDVRIGEVEGAVDAETSGGTVRVKDVAGPVRARSSGGPIEVRFSEAPAGEIRTSGGGIVVEFPEGEGVDLEARTSGGSVEIDPPLALEGRVEREQVKARINRGGARLALHTSGGSIRIRER